MSQKETQEYFEKEEYKVGDKFNEMLSFWIWIIKVEEDKILTIEGQPFDRLELKEYTKEDFKKKCSYSTPTMDDKYWVYYSGNSLRGVTDIIQHYKNRRIGNPAMNRQIKIEEITYDI